MYTDFVLLGCDMEEIARFDNYRDAVEEAKRWDCIVIGHYKNGLSRLLYGHNEGEELLFG